MLRIADIKSGAAADLNTEPDQEGDQDSYRVRLAFLGSQGCKFTGQTAIGPRIHSGPITDGRFPFFRAGSRRCLLLTRDYLRIDASSDRCSAVPSVHVVKVLAGGRWYSNHATNCKRRFLRRHLANSAAVIITADLKQMIRIFFL